MKKIIIIVLIFFVLLMIGFCSDADEKEQKETIEQVTQCESEKISSDEKSSEIDTQLFVEQDITKELMREGTVTTETVTVSLSYLEQQTGIETDELQADSSVEISTQPFYESVTQKEIMVWIPNSGTKYHRSATCSKMKNPSQVSLEKAVRLGYSACKKCY